MILLIASVLASPFTDTAAAIKEAWEADDGARVAAFCPEQDADCSRALRAWATEFDGEMGRFVENDDAALLEVWVYFPSRSGAAQAPVPVTFGLERVADQVRITSYAFAGEVRLSDPPLPAGLDLDAVDNPMMAHVPPVLKRWLDVNRGAVFPTESDIALCSERLRQVCVPNSNFNWAVATVETSTVEKVTVVGARPPVTTQVERIEAILWHSDGVGFPSPSRVTFTKTGDAWQLVDLSSAY